MEIGFPFFLRERKTGNNILVYHHLNQIGERTGLSFPAVTKGTQALEKIGIVQEITGRRRNRRFAYESYLEILSEGTKPL